MFEKLKLKLGATLGIIMAALSFKSENEIPIDHEKKALNFSPEDVDRLKEVFGENYERNMNAVNQEIKAYYDTSFDLKAAADEADAILREQVQKATLEANGQSSANLSTVELAKITAERLERQEEVIKKLMGEGIGNQPLEVIKRGGAEHSATHVFGIAKEYNKIEGRNWNQRLVGASHTTTDFLNDSNIPLLQQDLEHFVRENPTMLESLFYDNAQLPKEWSLRTGIIDRVANGFIVADEIVQGRAKGWAPKNKFLIEAEERRIYRKKIDIEFDGYDLQNIENTWIRMYNGSDGSHPWKMSFIAFLMVEIIKQQILDDRKAQINGIFVESPEGVAGSALASQNGLKYCFYNFRDVKKKYRATDLGPITDTNIVEKVNQLIKSIPEYFRNNEGLELGISEANLLKYRERAGKEYQLHRTTDTGHMMYELNFPIDYPNIKFQPLRDFANCDFMYITPSKNIEVLEYIPSEKGKFTVLHEKRNTLMFADYRLGIGLIYVGTKTTDDDKFKFEKQMVWSNEAPIFTEDQVQTLFDDKSGIIDYESKRYAGFNKIKISENWTTDITTLDNFPKGIFVEITGNTKLVAAKNLKKSTNINITSDFDLSTGGTITMFVDENGKFQELTRTTSEPSVILPISAKFSDGEVDAANFKEFQFVGTAATTMTLIDNGVEGKIIRIYGSNTAVLSVADVAGKIKVGTTVALADATKYVDLMYKGGVWYKTAAN